MNFRCLATFLPLLLPSLLSAGETGLIQRVSPLPSSYVCSAEEEAVRRARLEECKANWDAWGITPPPDAKDLMDPTICVPHGSVGGAGKFTGSCVDMIAETPVFFMELYINAGTMLGPGEDKHSQGYVFTKGSLREIQQFIFYQEYRKHCGLAPVDEAPFVSQNCTSRPSRKIDCRPFINRVRQAAACRHRLRPKLREMKSELEARAQLIFRAQQKRKRLARRYRRKLNLVRDKCAVILNEHRKKGFIGNWFKGLMNPLYYWKARANLLWPNPAEVSAYNHCIARETENDKEMMEELKEASLGWWGRGWGLHYASDCFRDHKWHRAICGAGGGTTILKVAKSGLKKILDHDHFVNFSRRELLNSHGLISMNHVQRRSVRGSPMGESPVIVARDKPASGGLFPWISDAQADAITKSHHAQIRQHAEDFATYPIEKKKQITGAMVDDLSIYAKERGVDVTKVLREDGTYILEVNGLPGYAGRYWHRLASKKNSEMPRLIFDPAEQFNVYKTQRVFFEMSHDPKTLSIGLTSLSLPQFLAADIAYLKHELRHYFIFKNFLEGKIEGTHGFLKWSSLKELDPRLDNYGIFTSIDEGYAHSRDLPAMARRVRQAIRAFQALDIDKRTGAQARRIYEEASLGVRFYQRAVTISEGTINSRDRIVNFWRQTRLSRPEYRSFTDGTSRMVHRYEPEIPDYGGDYSLGSLTAKLGDLQGKKAFLNQMEVEFADDISGRGPHLLVRFPAELTDEQILAADLEKIPWPTTANSYWVPVESFDVHEYLKLDPAATREYVGQHMDKNVELSKKVIESANERRGLIDRNFSEAGRILRGYSDAAGE